MRSRILGANGARANEIVRTTPLDRTVQYISYFIIASSLAEEFLPPDSARSHQFPEKVIMKKKDEIGVKSLFNF